MGQSQPQSGVGSELITAPQRGDPLLVIEQFLLVVGPAQAQVGVGARTQIPAQVGHGIHITGVVRGQLVVTFDPAGASYNFV